MPKYLIEREVPGAARMTPGEMRAVARRSVNVLQQLGPQIQWIESYVTGDNLYCVYIAPDEEMLREHARIGGFPCNRIISVAQMIDPTTAE